LSWLCWRHCCHSDTLIVSSMLWTLLSTIFQLYHCGQFVGGGNQRKPPTCRKSLTNFTTAPGEKHTPCHEGYSNSQLYHMVVGFTTTCAISDFKFCSWQGVLDTSLSGKVCQWLTTGRWFSLISSTNKLTAMI
jgi:hypothetical protein